MTHFLKFGPLTYHSTNYQILVLGEMTLRLVSYPLKSELMIQFDLFPCLRLEQYLIEF